MANPQKEQGHLDIANELVEAFALARISGSEYQVLWAIWRKTWCWKKKEDWISISQLQKMTGLSRWGVCKAKRHLVNKRLLICIKNKLKFNKNYEDWVVNKCRWSTNVHKVVNKWATGSQQKVDHKRNYTKETNTKERSKNLLILRSLKKSIYDPDVDPTSWAIIKNKCRAKLKAT